MNWLKNNIKKILSVLLIVLILTVTYFVNDSSLSEQEKQVETRENQVMELPQKSDEETAAAQKTVKEEKIKSTDETDKESASVNFIEENSKKDLPDSVEVQAEEKNKDLVCTLSVKCDTINKNIELFDEAKREVLPPDGTIFEEKNVVFYEGDSVFDVLLREMKQNGIHLEYVSTPVYDGVYLEGIGNIYEFDCGPRSGWIYCVNGEFPGYSCSQYKIKDGDVIEFLYTCDMGKDVEK